MNARRRSARYLIPLLALVAACDLGPLSPEHADPRLRTGLVPGADWSLIERPGFSFLLPPGYRQLPLQPIDSDAATYASGESSLHYDYGWYSGPWTDMTEVDGTPVEDRVRQRVWIGDRVAEMVSFRYGGTYVVRAWWERVARSNDQDEHLLVRIDTDDAHEREVLLASIHSVRFD